ncbi:MAG: DUF1800 domain-containing protein [Planctomycetota bacterium]
MPVGLEASKRAAQIALQHRPGKKIDPKKLKAAWNRMSRHPGLPGAPGASAASPVATAGAPGQGSGEKWPRDAVQLLLDRTSHGFHLGEYEIAKTVGYPIWFEYQLAHESIDDSPLEDLLAEILPSLAMSAKEIYDAYWTTNQLEIPFLELKFATMLRAAYSPRQLYERMVGFWSDHFNIDHEDDFCLLLKTVDDREVIRPHALGKFPDLLRASAESAAMNQYLDNFANVKGRAQENYARELMELHSLGVSGPYTENDVKEVARCLTGWTYQRKNPFFPNWGEFLFDPGKHDTGAKTVLGQQIPAGGGKSDGDIVLDILANHPSTAHFVATKLVRHFVADDPPQSLVQRVAATYLATGGDIKSMLRDIFSPQSPAAFVRFAQPKFRRPFLMATSLLRAFEIGLADPTGMLYEMIVMGQYPFGWHAPNGYPDVTGAWASNLRPRWSFASRLFDNQSWGTPIDRYAITARINDTGITDRAEAINVVLTGGRLARRDVNAIRAHIQSEPVYTWRVLREAIALAASSPSYQTH